ncbi:MAG: GIY-YIG nuclease family protein [Erysipelotrichaceae bacterium]|nr:GIY-YIG nuclease family protein [Erysipelotrichaceae bacterium]
MRGGLGKTGSRLHEFPLVLSMDVFSDFFNQSDFAYDIRFFFLALAIGLLLYFLFPGKDRRSIQKIRKLARQQLEVTPEEFFTIRSDREGKEYISKGFDFEGVYIIHNKTRRKYYVGQGANVMERISQHFMGHGNGDVYADYIYGDRFGISALALENSGFKTLDDLERYTIRYYHAYEKGYNRTRGNG